MRPPSSLATLETQLQNYSRAGITDLYLETFYHGLSTGKQGVFNRRFTYDYLQSAIALAARYNIRTHAWLEAAYWQYQTTGAYNFTANPDWRAINISTGQPGGDIADQIFANLAHPGVQAKLRAYTKELAAYPGLWGIQTDYHRYPLDNNTGDVYTVPWGYDAHMQGAFRASINSTTADIFTQADRPGRTHWNGFLAFRRAGVSEAARQMFLGIREVSADVVFSGAVFAAYPDNSAQISKCQDWGAWCAGGYLDQAVPMAYATSLTNKRNELNTAKAIAGATPVIAGLAITSGQPALADQLNVLNQVSLRDFILFEGNQITPANEAALQTWLAANDPPMRADLNGNGVMDSGDYDLFLASYTGQSSPSTSGARPNLNKDTVLDTTDHRLMREAIARYRIGQFGLLTQSDRDQLNASRGAAAASGGSSAKHLYDFNLDGAVNDADLALMERFGDPRPFAFGQVSFGDLGGPQPASVRVEWLQPNGALIQASQQALGSGGRFVLPTPGAGSYRLRVVRAPWLAQSFPVTVGATDVVPPVFALVNGDVNQDGEVDLTDVDLVIAAYLQAGGPADLNQDGEVDLTDVDIAIANYLSSGS